jgi:acyl-CoA synthetase (NDP forming)
MKEEKKLIPEFEAKEVLRTWGLPVPPCLVAQSPNQAVQCADKLGYPVVLKVSSPAIVHKSDVGGVKLNLADGQAVTQAYREIEQTCSPLDPKFKVLVQPMAHPGVEVILGVSEDGQFGKAIMFGLGGVFVELFQDASFRLVPVSRSQAMEMISSIKGFPLLKGYRGRAPADTELLADMVVSLSNLVTQYPAISELDLNPVIVYPKGAAVVDARIVLKTP